MELTIDIASQDEALFLFGTGDSNLRQVRDGLGVQVSSRNDSLRLSGEAHDVDQAAGIFHRMISMYRTRQSVPENYVEQQVAQIRHEADLRRASVETEKGADASPAKGVRRSAGQAPLTREQKATIKSLSRSPGQSVYIEAILRNEVVFCIGPAGTGKTYLAVRMAVDGLRSGEIRKLILCRPAVEAGEKLGFLPGDFQAKINPYLRPLYDALNDILGYDQVKRYIEREIIEIIPLAYMRGRTLNNAFIILDEGQNTTNSQMKMFLTRLGIGSRIVVNGDVTQTDLPEGQSSGLVQARGLIRGIEGIQWVRMQKPDIVRHSLVQRIVEAYEGEEPAGSPSGFSPGSSPVARDEAADSAGTG